MLFGTDPCWLMLGLMSVGMLLSFWIPNSGLTAMLLPIVVSVLDELVPITDADENVENNEEANINLIETAGSTNLHTNGCTSTGGHFNPDKVDHGAPSDSVRHVGDLGNILANSNGEADFVMVDTVIALEGRNSIIGRAFVIHEGVDDLGRGGDEGSRTTGNAGARLTCGIVYLVA